MSSPILISSSEDDNDDKEWQPIQYINGQSGNWISPISDAPGVLSLTSPNRSNSQRFRTFLNQPALISDDNEVKLKVKAAQDKISQLEQKLKDSENESLRLAQGLSDMEGKTTTLEVLLSKVENQEKKANKALTKTSGKLNEITDTLDKTESTILQLDGQIKNDKLQSIQILALFVAFFTFVSVEFQFFQHIRNGITIFALTLVLLGSLSSFVCLTFLGLSYYHSKGAVPNTALRFNKVFLIVVFIWSTLMICGGAAIGFVNNDVKSPACQNLENQVVKELNNDKSKTSDFLRESFIKQCAIQ